MAEEGLERSGLQRLPYTESDGETGPGGPSLLPVCLQPRRIIDRVYGLVGGRPSVSRPRTARTRRVVRVQRQQTPWSLRAADSDDEDNCETSMKTDSKVESGDTINQPVGLLHRRSTGRIEENNDRGVEQEDGEVTSPIQPEALPPDPSNRTEDMGEPTESENLPGPFNDLQPIQRGGVDPPSAPPLPPGDIQPPQQTPTSTPPQTARRLFDTLSIQSSARFGAQRWRSPQQTGGSPEGTDIELLLYQNPISRRRVRFPPTGNIRRTRLGNQVGGYSASHFPRSQRSGLPASVRRSWAGVGSEPGTRDTNTGRAATTFLFAPPRRQSFPPGLHSIPLARPPMSFSRFGQTRAGAQQGGNGVGEGGGAGGGSNVGGAAAGNTGGSNGGSGTPEPGQRTAGGGAGNMNEMVRSVSRDPSPQPGTSPEQQQQQQQQLVSPSLVGRSNHNRNHHISDSDRLGSGGGRQGLNNVVAVPEDTVMLSNQESLQNHNCNGELQGRRGGGGGNDAGAEEIAEESMPVSEDLAGRADEGQEVESGVTGLSNRMHDLELENERLLSERDKYLRMYECEVLCQICCERKKNVLALPCSHYNYCQQCLEKHWEGKAERECPLCRQYVSSILCVQIGQ